MDTSSLFKIEGAEKGTPIINLLLFQSNIPCYSSYLSFGEIIGKLNKKNKQIELNQVKKYLLISRSIMSEFSINNIRRAEPPEDKVKFLNLANNLIKKWSKVGGGDIWHLIAFVELKETQDDNVTFLTFDNELAKVTLKEKLQVVNGNNINPVKLYDTLRKNNKLKFC